MANAHTGRWSNRCGPGKDRGSDWWPISANSAEASRTAGPNWDSSSPAKSNGRNDRCSIRRITTIPSLRTALEKVHTDRLYAGLDWLLPHKEAIEKHLQDRLGQLFDWKYDLIALFEPVR